MEQDEDGQPLTLEYLNSLIEASAAAAAQMRERGWSNDDDAWDDLGPRGQMELAMAKTMRTVGMLARVVLDGNGTWKNDEIVTFYESGMGIYQIADALNVTNHAVRKCLREAGVATRGRGPGLKARKGERNER